MRLVGALALAIIGLGAATVPAAAEPPSSYVVVFADGVEPAATTTELERTHGFRADLRYTTALSGFAARLATRQRDLIAANPSVASVHEDRAVRLTPPARASSTKTALATGVRRIGGGTKAASVAVAVLDTGVDLGHPDLHALAGTNCVGGPGRRQTAVADGNGHGTHVSGTIGGTGGTGVAPGTAVYAVKVLDDGGRGSTSQLICGIDWVAANADRLGIRVASMSLGMPGPADGDCGHTGRDVLHRAICRAVAAGIVFVVAAGNAGADLSGFVPAGYPEVLAVTAVADSDGTGGGRGGATVCGTRERDDSAATFSNYSGDATTLAHVIAAPGVCIRSTWPGRTYRAISGTSMAAPHVAASVALCITTRRCAGTPRQIIERLIADATAHAGDASGFAGDERAPLAHRHYGMLVWAGAY